MRATYHRPHGLEYRLGFPDGHADFLAGFFAERKRVLDLCAAFERLRACYPRRRRYVILPNVHDDPRFLRLLRKPRIAPIFTPTNASWLNLDRSSSSVGSR